MFRPNSLRQPLQQHENVPLALAKGFGRVQTLAADATIADLDPEADLIVSTATSPVVLQLPSLTTAIIGQVYMVKQQAAGAVAVTADGSDTIDGLGVAATTGAYTQMAFAAVEYGAGVREWLLVT